MILIIKNKVLTTVASLFLVYLMLVVFYLQQCFYEFLKVGVSLFLFTCGYRLDLNQPNCATLPLFLLYE